MGKSDQWLIISVCVPVFCENYGTPSTNTITEPLPLDLQARFHFFSGSLTQWVRHMDLFTNQKR